MTTAPNTNATLPPSPKPAISHQQLFIVGFENPKEKSRLATENELQRLKPKIQAKFWKKLKAKGECLEFTGVLKDGRYGWMRIGSKCYYTHRIAAWLIGLVDSPIAPKDQSIRGYVLHLCDNPACCNPKHLWIGNTSDNQQDCYRKQRRISPWNNNFYAFSAHKKDMSATQFSLPFA